MTIPSEIYSGNSQCTPNIDSSSADIDSEPERPELESPNDGPQGEEKREGAGMQIPLELLSRTLSAAMDSGRQCAFDLLLPDWSVCKREDPLLEKTMELTRIVTYTRGAENEVSTLSTEFGHGDADHVFLPTKRLDNRFLALNDWCFDESFRVLFLEGAQIFELDVDGVPDNIVDESFLETCMDIFPIRGQRLRAVLPFDDEYPDARKKAAPSGSPHLYKLIRHIVIRSPLTLMGIDALSMVGPDARIGAENLKALDMAIDLDRGSPLWLSWSQMPSLESVLLDLRIYSHDLNTSRGCIGKDEVIERAKEMGRWLRLKLLVIAGLQSYSFGMSYKSYTAQLVEEADELDGEPNWIKIFMPAVRPGGRLILVDRLMDGMPRFFFLGLPEGA